MRAFLSPPSKSCFEQYAIDRAPILSNPAMIIYEKYLAGLLPKLTGPCHIVKIDKPTGEVMFVKE